tara:strand:- start:1336 stop:1974 length:639 start_codon:yes stop_codon:yes gene_type:complete
METTRLAESGPRLRERRCAATGEVKPETALIRLGIAPDGLLVPDLAARLPGRGVWVSADRASVDRAIKIGGFARAAKRGVTLPDDLAGQIESLLADRALSLLGLARRAGMLTGGFDAVKAGLKAARPVWRIEAVDAARDGRAKLDRLCQAAWGPVPVAGCFSAAQLGAATGREALTHGILSGGSQARSFSAVMERLAGFREIDPGGDAQENG